MENTNTPTVTQEPAPDDQQAVQQMYNFAAQHMSAGKSDAQIQALLLAQGLSSDAAATVVQELRPEFRAARHQAARKDMLHGGLWFGGGLLVTGVSYVMASSGGGSYFMTWGAIIFGGFQFFKGAFRYMQN